MSNGSPLSGKTVQALEKGIRIASSILNVIAMVLLFLLMVQGAADVIGRYIFNRPIMGTMERGSVLLALMVFLAWGYTQIAKGHVNVSFFLLRCSPRAQATANFATSLLLLIFFGLIVWQAIITAQRYHEGGRLIYVVHWPLAPFQLLVSVSAFVFCLVLIMEMVQFLFQMKRGG